MPAKRCRADADQQEDERVKIRAYDPVKKISKRLETDWTEAADYVHTEHGVDASIALAKIKEQEIKLKTEISLLHKITGNLRHSTVNHQIGGLSARTTPDLTNSVLESLEQAVEQRLDGPRKGVGTSH